MIHPWENNKPELKARIIEFLRKYSGRDDNVCSAYHMSIKLGIECNSIYCNCLRELNEEGIIIKSARGYKLK